LYFGICGLILSPCPFSPQLARRRRRRRRKTKKKQKKEDEEEEKERCSPNKKKKKKKNIQTQDFRIFHLEFAGGY
jgi:hypothetical protein